MKVAAANRRARYEYEIVDTIEAGIVLTGQEVKSCREGNAHLAGAYVSFGEGKPLLKGAAIAKYRFASEPEDYDPKRSRELLLKKQDVARLKAAVQEKGVTVVPLELRAGKTIKVLLGLGRGRKRHDKRQKLKEKDWKRRKEHFDIRES